MTILGGIGNGNSDAAIGFAKGPPRDEKRPERPLDDIGERLERQSRRIRIGLQSGQLTGPEAARLLAENQGLWQEYAAALKDGKLDQQEKSALTKKLDAASEQIYDEKHDPQNAPKSIAQRFENQINRIQDGIARDLLSPQMAQALMREVQMIRSLLPMLTADGNLSGQDRQLMNALLNVSSRDIYLAKHPLGTWGLGGNKYTGGV